ncbi:nitrile hydratase accessory protein [Aquabacter sp. P-9]|uniref:nitrile hydratase accessory protein n=1 Tax=Aquabacter sediminis TaxID=3029197 RepID=UPI00237E2C11|nr:nitrile hydratase accessory protein [Aquabacter sp. P-9]MDE1567025.1 nitrile hydratase accessory protein [Aquabacter sp. P-9]
MPAPLCLDGPDAAPVFSAPWEAQVFAMVVALHSSGLFTWSEWAARLGAAATRGDGATDYNAWLAALEGLLVERAVTTHGALASWQTAWDHAARATPHGKPIIVDHPPALG